jgi:hypothetical protein
MTAAKSYRLGIVGTCGLPAAYGGFETLAEALVRYLATSEYRILVFAQQGYRHISEEAWDQLVIPLRANGASSVFYDIVSLFLASQRCDSIFLLGVSGAISLPILRIIFPNVRYVVHIDGLEWLRPKWGVLARRFLKFSERISIHFGDAFIVDNLGIADYVARSYGKRYLKRASLLSYGTTMLDDDMLPPGNCISVVDACNGRTVNLVNVDYFLVLGRAEPENNFEMIIQAYSRSKIIDRGVKLVIISNAVTTQHGKDLLLRFSAVDGLCFALPEYDSRIVRSIRRHAMAYIHGHSAGGTNPSLVEAIAAARPIFSFDVPYNRYTTAGIASYFCDSSSLQLILDGFFGERLSLLTELQDLARANYDWLDVTRDYYTLFGVISSRQSSGLRTLMGRFALRLKRKIARLLIRILYLSRRSRAVSSRKYEYRLPKSP